MQAGHPPLGPLCRHTFRLLRGELKPLLCVGVVGLGYTVWAAVFGDFIGSGAVWMAESLMPLLGAFLASRCLLPEYQSGMDGLLAGSPVSLGRLTAGRLAAAMLAAVAVTAVWLQAGSMILGSSMLLDALPAGLPSLWALSLLALTVASLFRQPAVGFAAAASLWGLDQALGYPGNPLLSLQGRHAALEFEAAYQLWGLGKGLLLLVGSLLFIGHERLLARRGRVRMRAQPAGALDALLGGSAAIVALAVLYVVSGVVAVVSYGYIHRADKTGPSWLRARVTAYGPLPVARLFGPAFVAYVSAPAGPWRGAGDLTDTRVLQLQEALERYPRSIWADAIAMELADTQRSSDVQAAARLYLSVPDRYPRSPFAVKALGKLLARRGAAMPFETSLTAAQRMVAEYPAAPEASEALDLLEQSYPYQVTPEALLQAVQAGAASAPNARRARWLAAEARATLDLGRADEADELAKQAAALGQQVLSGERRGSRSEAARAVQSAQEVIWRSGATR
jgi:hypothetical protein